MRKGSRWAAAFGGDVFGGEEAIATATVNWSAVPSSPTAMTRFLRFGGSPINVCVELLQLVHRLLLNAKERERPATLTGVGLIVGLKRAELAREGPPYRTSVRSASLVLVR